MGHGALTMWKVSCPHGNGSAGKVCRLIALSSHCIYVNIFISIHLFLFFFLCLAPFLASLIVPSPLQIIIRQRFGINHLYFGLNRLKLILIFSQTVCILKQSCNYKMKVYDS